MSDMSKGQRPLTVDDERPKPGSNEAGWRPNSDDANAVQVGHRQTYDQEPAAPFRETERPATVGKTGNEDEDYAA